MNPPDYSQRFVNTVAAELDSTRLRVDKRAGLKADKRREQAFGGLPMSIVCTLEPPRIAPAPDGEGGGATAWVASTAAEADYGSTMESETGRRPKSWMRAGR